MKNKKRLLFIILPIILLLLILIPITLMLINNNKKVTITYQSADTSKGTVSIESEDVKIKGNPKGSTAIENPGYVFVNWTKDDEEVSKDSTFKPAKTKNKNVIGTYVANFEANTYSVTFDGNESDEPYSQIITQTYDQLYTLPETNPERLGYDFVGWFTDITDGEEVTVETIVKITADQTLYAHWTEACVAEGTLITMKDGSMKAVENVELGDEIRTFNHETGELSYSSVCFVWKSSLVGKIFTLHFENDVDVTIIDRHGFYDNDNKEYAFISLDNVDEYIGHHFYNGDLNCLLKLESYERVNEKINAYAIVTSGHLNHMANGMLSMCDGPVEYIANIFEFNEDMTYNQEDKEKQISTFGLMDRDDFLKYKGWTSDEYDHYNFKYLKIMVGKGILTWEDMQAYSDLYEVNNI